MGREAGGVGVDGPRTHTPTLGPPSPGPQVPPGAPWASGQPPRAFFGLRLGHEASRLLQLLDGTCFVPGLRLRKDVVAGPLPSPDQPWSPPPLQSSSPGDQPRESQERGSRQLLPRGRVPLAAVLAAVAGDGEVSLGTWAQPPAGGPAC